MKTSPATSSSEARFREALLNVLFAQWQALGVPFHSDLDGADREVIDPEALIWTSLAFVDKEPRLAEGVKSWVTANRARVNRQRIANLARASGDDARGSYWSDLFGTGRPSNRDHRRDSSPSRKEVGAQSRDDCTLLLRTRDVLGNDCRSFLIVYLLGSERGIRLREVSKWSGYWYRSVSEAASGWERAEVVRIEHGYCVLSKPWLWRELFECQSERIATIDWLSAFKTSIDLLHTLSTARENRFAADHPLVSSAIESTSAALSEAAGGLEPTRTPTLTYLQSALAG